jgi:hypothetical protein
LHHPVAKNPMKALLVVASFSISFSVTTFAQQVFSHFSQNMHSSALVRS